MSIGNVNGAGYGAGATPASGDVVEGPGPNRATFPDVLVSSAVGDRSHGDLLGSLGAPPAMWSLKQSAID